jgi:transposase-like protein
MRNLEEHEEALNRYFKEGESYQYIARTMDIPVDTVKSWCRRYRVKMGIPKRDAAKLREEGVEKKTLHTRTPKTDSAEDRIARLEMEVDLLRNFLILKGRR